MKDFRFEDKWWDGVGRETCQMCGRKKNLSLYIGICPECLKNSTIEEIKPIFMEKHAFARKQFFLSPYIPQRENGIECKLCSANCRLEPGEWGWCGLRKNHNGKFVHLSTRNMGLLHFYLDPQVTNCCNAWFCPAGTGIGYPRFAVKKGPEYGYYNLALFLYGCSFNCLFCQNWEHKRINEANVVSSEHLVNLTLTNEKITCWCWFGGSPEPQLPFALYTSQKILEQKPRERVLRICFEWNGDGHPNLVKKAALLSMMSGGNIKFDFKGWTPALHYVLTGRTNERVLFNIAQVGQIIAKESEDRMKNNVRPYPLGITTLLVPYYVDAEEVEHIASFLADIDPQIPYSLLVFHPAFMLKDLPITSKKQVIDAFNAAKKHLNKIHIGNLHLLGCRSINDLLREAA